MARLDPFAEADVDLHDNAVERRDDAPPGDLHFGGRPFVFFGVHFELGDLLLMLGLLGFESRLVERELFDVELRLRNALGEMFDRFVRAAQLGLGDFGGFVGVADFDVAAGLFVGGVEGELGGAGGHLGDLVVDLGEELALLDALPFADGDGGDDAGFLCGDRSFGDQAEDDGLDFDGRVQAQDRPRGRRVRTSAAMRSAVSARLWRIRLIMVRTLTNR